MKNYKEVELQAKNAPTGSYAAGCPANYRKSGSYPNECINCERTA